MEHYDWRKEAELLARDTTSGAQAICLKASEIVIKAIDSQSHETRVVNPAEFLREIAREIKRVKPAMAGLYSLAAEIISGLENAGGEEARDVEMARRMVVEYRSRLITSNDGIASHVIELLPLRGCIATCSNSGTVKVILKKAKEWGKIRRAFISEARPAYEGKLAARELSEAGIALVFTSDAALPGLVEQCDAVLVGGDALCPSGLVNKAGTYPLALAAQRTGKPFIAALGSEKVIPFNIPENYMREDPSALWDTHKISIQVLNRIFEYTPLELIDHVVTEDGITSGAEIPYIFAKMEINPYIEEP